MKDSWRQALHISSRDLVDSWSVEREREREDLFFKFLGQIINTGVKAFARSDNKACTCDYRLASDGLYSMLSYVKSRIVKIPKEDLVILLLNNDKDTPPRIETLSSATQEAVKHLPSGSFVIVVDCKIGEDGPNFTIELIGWRGNSSIRAYVALNERVHYLRMCGQDVSRFGKWNSKFKFLNHGDCFGKSWVLELFREKQVQRSCQRRRWYA